MRMTIEHVAGRLRGRTQVIDAESVTFGTSSECGVVFDREDAGAVYPIHAEVVTGDHRPIIKDRSGRRGIFVNGECMDEALLRDGDLVRFGDNGPQVRVRFPEADSRAGKSLRRIVADSRDIIVRTPHPRFLSPLYLMRHLLRDITIHASPKEKLTAALVVLTPFLIIVTLAVVLWRQHQAAEATKRRMVELIVQLETGRLTRDELERRIEEQRRMASELAGRQAGELEALTARLNVVEAQRHRSEDIRSLREQLVALQASQRAAAEIVRRFEHNVGLLQGGYAFRETGSGKLLRYQGLDESGEPLVDPQGNPLVTVEGNTAPVTIYFAGTAFVLDEQGTVVTNRHLVRMWESFEPAKQAIEAGFTPELTVLRLFLPGQENAYRLTDPALSDRADLAILRTDRPPSGIAPLVLASEPEAVHVGEPIVMLSYPGTIDVLLARGPAAATKDILAMAGRDVMKLSEEVAKRGLVRPLVTQGHVSGLSADLLTYEALSGSGSSGAPIFNQAGSVVGVNHAGLQRVGGMQLAIPSRLVKDLLAARHGTRRPSVAVGAEKGS